MSLWRKGIIQVGDFFDTTSMPPKILTLQEINQKYNINLDFLSYHRVRKTIEHGSEKLGHKTFNPELSDAVSPRQPLLFKLSNLQQKGCRVFRHILRVRDFMVNSIEVAERKLQSEINATFSIKFWDD